MCAWNNKDSGHKTVNHPQGEYARDADGNSHYEVYVNTIEGI